MQTILNLIKEALDLTGEISDQRRRKRLLDLLLACITGLVILGWFTFVIFVFILRNPKNPGLIYALVGAPIMVIGLILIFWINQRQTGYWAGVLFVGIVFLGGLLDEPQQVAAGRSLIYFSIPIVLSGLIISPLASFITAMIAAVVNAAYVYFFSPYIINISAIFTFFVLALITWLATSSLEKTIKHLGSINLALRESEERYRTLVEISPDMISVCQLDGTMEMVNQASLKNLGYESMADLVGKKIWNFVSPEDQPLLAETLQQITIDGTEQPRTIEFQTKKGDGSQIWLELKIAAIKNPVSGQVTSFLGVGRDVTRRRQAEQVLQGEKDRLEETIRESEAAYQSLVDNSDQGLVLFQKNRVLKANHAFARMCNLSLQELYAADAERFISMIHSEDREGTLSLVQKVINREVDVLRHETRVLLEDGQVRWGELTFVPISFMGQPAVQITAIDMTERKQAELALREAKDGLETRVAERTAALKASREQLRELTRQIVTAQEDERHRVSRELHDEAGQILIGLKYRLGEALSCLPMEYTDARQRISLAMDGTDQAMAKIRNLAHDLRPPSLDVAGINLSLQGYCREFSEKTSLPVLYKGTDLPGLSEEISISLYRILQESLINIARHAPQATRIHVTLACSKNLLTLTVADNGPGYQPKPGHTGIGILGIQERLALLGGLLQIRPNGQKGTRLKAVIPLAESKSR